MELMQREAVVVTMQREAAMVLMQREAAMVPMQRQHLWPCPVLVFILFNTLTLLSSVSFT